MKRLIYIWLEATFEEEVAKHPKFWFMVLIGSFVALC